MLRKTFSFALVLLALGTLALAEGDQSHTSAPPQGQSTARPDGPADTNFKEKTADFLAKIFEPMPKNFLSDNYAAKVPADMAEVKKGNSQPLSTDVLTPLFGTLNNAQFDKLMTEVDKRIKEEKATDKTVDNNFIDFLEEVQKYGKVIQQIPDETTEKNKAEAKIFKKDFDTQQGKNKELLAKVDEIKKLKPEQKEERAKLQKELAGRVNQQAVLSYLKGQLDTGSETNKQVARDLRDALAVKTESGHNVIDTVWKGQTERLIYDSKDPKAADEAFNQYAAMRGKFAATSLAPATHDKPNRNLSLDATGNLVEAVPTGFKPPPGPPVPGPTATPGNGGGSDVAKLSVDQIKDRLRDTKMCGKCHSAGDGITVSGSDVKSLKITKSSAKSPKEILKEFDAGGLMNSIAGTSEGSAAKAFLTELAKAQGN